MMCKNTRELPLDIINVANNISIEQVGIFDGLFITEQHLYDVIRTGLGNADGTVRNALISFRYGQIGFGHFNPIIEACRRSPFKGEIFCKLHK